MTVFRGVPATLSARHLRRRREPALKARGRTFGFVVPSTARCRSCHLRHRRIGRIEGPLVGALIFWALNKFLSDYGTTWSRSSSKGLWGYAQQRWGWSLFPTQRKLLRAHRPMKG
jgi:hypothetical protein